jgi:hypothetical protein
MTSKYARLSMLVVTLTLGACTSSAGGATTDPTQPPAAAQVPVVNLQPSVLTATPTPEPTASPSPGPSDASAAESQAPAAPIDPCTLLTTAEASNLIGVKLGAGVSTTVDQDRECVFKKGLTEVKLILAPPAPDVATATGYWDAERAQAPADFQVKDLSVFDRSAFGSASGAGISISALFVLDGKQAFDVFCANPACGENASVAAAELVAGRLP